MPCPQIGIRQPDFDRGKVDSPPVHRYTRRQGFQRPLRSAALTRTPLAPITYRTLNDIVTDQLRDAILCGQFPPGATLNQRDIADHLSVSRMPVREAFRALELEGLIRGLPRRKAVVVTLQPGDIDDIYDILATLERRAAEKATLRHDESSIAQFREVLSELRECDADPISLLALCIPMCIFYEISILIGRIVTRRRATAEAAP